MRYMEAMKYVIPALLLCAVFAPGVAFAQDEPKRDAALDLDETLAKTVIDGSEHMPDFTVFIEREDLSRAFDLELEEKFLAKIVEAVGKEPF